MAEGLKARKSNAQEDAEMRGGFLHAWINGHFQTLADGKRVFYPFGPLGRSGFEVTSTEQEMILRLNVRSARRFLIGILFALMFVLIFSETSHESWMPVVAVCCSLPLQWAYSRIYFWRFTSSMEPIDVPNSLIGYARSMAVTVNPTLLMGQTAMGLLLAGAIAYLAYRDQDLSRLALAAFVMVGYIPHAMALWSWTRLGAPGRR